MPGTMQDALGYAVTGAVLCVGGLALSPFAVLLARRAFAGRNVYFARWGFSHVGFAVLAGIGGALLAPLLVSGEGVLAMLCRTEIVLGCAALAVLGSAHRTHPDGWRCLGFARGRHGAASLVGAATLLLTLPLVFGVGIGWMAFLAAVGADVQPSDLALRLVRLRGAELALAAAIAVAIGPFLEELLFRAFLQPLLVQNLDERLGIAATALLFAGLHDDVVGLVPLFVLGLVLGGVMQRTQRLVSVWIVHGAFNAVVLALAWYEVGRGPAG